MNRPYKALYIHIPFCRSKCFYCDFFSEAIDASDPRIDAYIEDVVMQIFKSGRKGKLSEVESVYIGGGTPSYLGTRALTSLLYAIGLSLNLTDQIEVTVEANPDSFDERIAKDIYALGANRVSIGVQSFDDRRLKSIGRVHDSKEAIAAIEAAKTRFENISIDLMCGLPGQNVDEFKEGLALAIEMEVPHISIYPLTIEDGTRMKELVERGELDIACDDDVADMLEAASLMLGQSGYEHYEVSNYAKPGFQSRHNSSYWNGSPYLGIGHGAVSMIEDDDRRIRIKDGKLVDEMTHLQACCEDLILAMRTSRGVLFEYVSELNETVFPGLLDKFSSFEEAGLVEARNSRFVPTLSGMLLGNEIYESILDFFK